MASQTINSMPIKSMRLDKFLANQGIGSRKQVKNLLKAGLITVNDEIVKQSDFKINPEKDIVALEGTPFQYAAFIYIMLHKPAGYISATTDNYQNTILDLIKPQDRHKDLFPVGRLDKDTEGLLLLTNDGQLAHNLLSPRKHVDKTYYAELSETLPTNAIEQFAHGIDIGEDILTLPAKLEILDSPVNAVYVTIHEGKFHQIKRMFYALGTEVTYLKRISMGTLTLDETLKKGFYRMLTDEEIKTLKDFN